MGLVFMRIHSKYGYLITIMEINCEFSNVQAIYALYGVNVFRYVKVVHRIKRNVSIRSKTVWNKN